MASEDIDYMSDDILLNCEQQDVRPGLIYGHSQKRTHTIYKQKLLNQLPKRDVLEEERRTKGLEEAISSDNKGFALLQKMGYKAGSGIGKSGSGIVEPVPIALKTNRGGLGRESALREIKEKKLAIKARLQKRRNQVCDIDAYRSQMIKKAAERYAEGDLRKSQKICENLDKRKGIEEPAEYWFWFTREEEEHEEEGEPEGDEENYDNDEEVEEVEFETSEKLEMLTLYLRRTYCYCIWCATEFEDEKDMQENCPGPTRADHE